MIPPIIVVCQLSLEPISAPAALCNSNVGLANVLGMLYGGRPSSGPMARIITLFGPCPLNDKTANHDVLARLNKGAGGNVSRVVAVGARFGWKAIAPTILEAKVVRTPLGVNLRMLPAEPATNRLSALSIARPTLELYPRQWCFAARSG